MSGLNKRRRERFSSNAPVALRWREESGEARFEHGTVLDYSENGVRVELLEPIESPFFVLLGMQGQNTKARASKVRYCVTKQAKYIVGLEFSLGERPVEKPETTPDVAEVIQSPQFSMLMFRP